MFIVIRKLRYSIKCNISLSLSLSNKVDQLHYRFINDIKTRPKYCLNKIRFN